MVCAQLWADRNEDNLSRCPVPCSIRDPSVSHSLLHPVRHLEKVWVYWKGMFVPFKGAAFASRESLAACVLPTCPPQSLADTWSKKTPWEGANEFLVDCWRSAPQPPCPLGAFWEQFLQTWWYLKFLMLGVTYISIILFSSSISVTLKGGKNAAYVKGRKGRLPWVHFSLNLLLASLLK